MAEVRSFDPLVCGACGVVVGQERDGRLKVQVRSRLMAITKSGRVEINCPGCKKAMILPLVYEGVPK